MAKIFNWRRRNASESPDPSPWLVRQDDYSVQISMAEDELFWIRVERPYKEEAVVSDCKRSAQTAVKVAQALGLALAASGDVDALRGLKFTNIVPGRGRADAQAEAAQLTLVLAAMFPGPGRRVANLHLRSNGEKFDLLVDLAAEPG
ncbi:MAG: hypothetical protein GC206_14485 [Alphaproteobacteria bacterium]|nr:hypothetical protein [Alphaproteobacteria bacterium]